jgi:ferredoxin-NADP reductase
MAAPILNSLKFQFDKTLFNTDFKSYFSPIFDSVNRDSNFKFIAKVIDIKVEREDVISITLQTPKKWKSFVPGQFIEITFKINAVYYTRIFSISSPLNQLQNERTITLTIQKQLGGKVTNWIFDKIKVNSIVGISEAKGDFTLSKSDKSIMIIAGGSGITPFRSILYQCIESNSDVVLLYYCKSGQHLYADELTSLEKYKNIKIKCLASDIEGRFSPSHLASYCPDFLSRKILICGPNEMIEDTQACLLKNNVENKNILFEYFKKKNYNTHSSEKIIGKLELKNREFTIDNTKSILEHLESNMLQPKYGCRMGLCKQCTCTKQSGIVFNQLTQKYSEDGKEDIQICVSTPIGDVKINL